MNTNDSKVMVDKLENLMSAAQEFGEQAEQLSKARGDFDSYLAAVKETDSKMVALVEKCDNYIEVARRLVERDLSAQIKEIVQETESSVKDCKEQCEFVTARYKETVELFEQQKPIFEEEQNKLVATVEGGLDKALASSRQEFADLEEKSAALVQNILDSLERSREVLSSSISEEAVKSAGGFEAIKEENQALKAELTEVKSMLFSAMEWQKKNGLLLKLGAIAASLAAIASIVGLFIR